MNPRQFQIFSDFRDELRSYCSDLSKAYEDILPPLQRAASKGDTPPYPVETPVVYNTALDEVTLESDIRLIVIGDNPGKDEQRLLNRKYLVGQSGKIAAGFFLRHPEFGVDFRKNAIILNKTPIHTAKTKHLRYLMRNGGSCVRSLVQESQVFMAERTAALHKGLLAAAGEGEDAPELWLVGYAELRERGIFTEYRKALIRSYEGDDEGWGKVFVFQHFSMNRFTIDLGDFMRRSGGGARILEAARELGLSHKNDILVLHKE